MSYAKSVISVLLFLVLIHKPQAQAIVVKGQVIDSIRAVPLEGAHVYSMRIKQLVVVDPNGKFEIELPKEETDLTISHMGYQTKVTKANSDGSMMFIRLKESIKVLDSFVMTPPDVLVKNAWSKFKKQRASGVTASKIIYCEDVAIDNQCAGYTQGLGFLIANCEALKKPTWEFNEGIVFSDIRRSNYQDSVKRPWGYGLKVVELFYLRRYWLSYVDEVLSYKYGKLEYSIAPIEGYNLIKIDVQNSADKSSQISFTIDRGNNHIQEIALSNPAKNEWVRNYSKWSKDQQKRFKKPELSKYLVKLLYLNGSFFEYGFEYKSSFANGFRESAILRAYQITGKLLHLDQLTDKRYLQSLGYISSFPRMIYSSETWKNGKERFSTCSCDSERIVSPLGHVEKAYIEPVDSAHMIKRLEFDRFQLDLIKLLKSHFDDESK